MGATLLARDAWFDVMTASAPSDEWVISVAWALLVELPFAVVLPLAAQRLLRLTLQRVRDRTGAPSPGVDTRSHQRVRHGHGHTGEPCEQELYGGAKRT